MHLRERAFSFQATDAIPEYDVRPGDWVHVDDSFADSLPTLNVRSVRWQIRNQCAI
jgi:hypothetical protein